jgi:hypothetical protein
MSSMSEASVRHEAAPPALPTSKTAVLWYWIPAVAWAGMVLLASSDPLSAKHTGEVLLAVLTWVFGHVDAHTFALVHFLVRKSAHFIEYAILSALCSARCA